MAQDDLFIVYLIFEISNIFKLFCILQWKTLVSDYKNKQLYIYIHTHTYTYMYAYICVCVCIYTHAIKTLLSFEFALLCKFSRNRSGRAQGGVGHLGKGEMKSNVIDQMQILKFDQVLY